MVISHGKSLKFIIHSCELFYCYDSRTTNTNNATKCKLCKNLIMRIIYANSEDENFHQNINNEKNGSQFRCVNWTERDIAKVLSDKNSKNTTTLPKQAGEYFLTISVQNVLILILIMSPKKNWINYCEDFMLMCEKETEGITKQKVLL